MPPHGMGLLMVDPSILGPDEYSSTNMLLLLAESKTGSCGRHQQARSLGMEAFKNPRSRTKLHYSMINIFNYIQLHGK